MEKKYPIEKEITDYKEYCKRHNLNVKNADNLHNYLSSKKRK
jgi:hypothetical protein